MAGSLDMVVMVSRVSKGPERILNPGGKGSYVRFQMASHFNRRDGFGDWVQTNEFYWIHCHDRLSDIVEKVLYPGALVSVIGGFRRVRSGYDGDVIINARDIQLIGDCQICKPKRTRKESEEWDVASV